MIFNERQNIIMHISIINAEMEQWKFSVDLVKISLNGPKSDEETRKALTWAQ